MKKILGFFVFYIAIVLCLFFFTDIDITIIQNINYNYLVVACLSYLMIVLLRGKKLQIILNSYGNIPYSKSTLYSASSQFIGAFVPGRAGEILLSTFLKFKHNFNFSMILPTLFLDKIVELFMVVLLAFVSLTLFESKMLTKVIHLMPNIQTLYVLVALLILILLILFIFKAKIFKFFQGLLENIRQGVLIPVKHPKVGIAMLILSIIIVLMEMLTLFILFNSLIDVSFTKIIIAYAFGMVAGIISMVPGGQGTTELSMVTIMMLWGYSAKDVVIPILISRIMTYIVLGIYSAPILPEVFKVLQFSAQGILNKRKKRS